MSSLLAVAETDEERRSRSRGSFKSRRSGLNQDIAEDRKRHRSRSRDSRISDSRTSDTRISDSRTSSNSLRNSTDTHHEQRTSADHERFSTSQNPSSDRVSTDNQRNSVQNSIKDGSLESGKQSIASIKSDKSLVVRVSDIESHVQPLSSVPNSPRFPGGDRITRTPPRRSSTRRSSSSLSAPNSNSQSPVSGSNTSKYEAFDIQIKDVGPKVVMSFLPSQKEATPKLKKKATKETFTFISIDDKPKSVVHRAMSKGMKHSSSDSRLLKTNKQPERRLTPEPRVEVGHDKIDEEEKDTTVKTRRRTYSLESDQKLNTTFEKEPEVTTTLNTTFEKEPEVTTNAVPIGNKIKDDTEVPQIRVETSDMDDSLGLIDQTVLESIDMELTEVIDLKGIRLNTAIDTESKDISNKPEGEEIDINDETVEATPNKNQKTEYVSNQSEIEPETTRKSARKRNPSAKSKTQEVEEGVPVPKRNPSTTRSKKKMEIQDSDEGSTSDASVNSDVAKPKRTRKAKTVAAETLLDSSSQDSSESAASEDESCGSTAFKFYRSKPGKLNFIVGRKDINGRPQDPVAQMKKSRSKSKKLKKKSVTLETDGSVFDLSVNESMPVSLGDMRKQKGSESSQDEIAKAVVEESKPEEQNTDEQEKVPCSKSVFKIPAAKPLTKNRRETKVLHKSDTQPNLPEIQSRSRRTTVVKSYVDYFESSANESMLNKPESVMNQNENSKDKAAVNKPTSSDDKSRRNTKILRRVSTATKVAHDVIPVDDVTANDESCIVVNDTIVQENASVELPVEITNEDSHTDKAKSKPKPQDYSKVRRETHVVVKAREIPKIAEIRRQTQPAPPEVKSVPGTEVTLPEPDIMPEAPGLEMLPSTSHTSVSSLGSANSDEDDVTLDLTKLIKSVNQEKRVREAASQSMASAAAEFDDDITLNLTTLLKQVNTKKMLENAQTNVPKLPVKVSKEKEDQRNRTKKITPKPQAKFKQAAEPVIKAKTQSESVKQVADKSAHTSQSKKDPKRKTIEIPAKSKIAKRKPSDMISPQNIKMEIDDSERARSPSVEVEDIAFMLTNDSGNLRRSIPLTDKNSRNLGAEAAPPKSKTKRTTKTPKNSGQVDSENDLAELASKLATPKRKSAKKPTKVLQEKDNSEHSEGNSRQSVKSGKRSKQSSEMVDENQEPDCGSIRVKEERLS